MFEVPTPLGPMQRLGYVAGSSVVDVNLAYRRLLDVPRAAAVADAVVPPDMLAFIETGGIALDAARTAVAYVESLGEAQARGAERLLWQLDEIRLLAPLPNPRSLREFGQFIGHVTHGGRRELADVWYEAPHYWKGNPSTIVGPDTPIAWPDGVERLDFELEIACVIGRAGVDVPESEALHHVFGFAIFNDVCARDLQSRELPAGKGPSKSHDFLSVMGPMLVTPDELDLEHFTGRVVVNGEQWAQAATEDMYFSWPAVVAHASRFDGIVPGDVLVSGTLTGCSAIEHYDDWQGSGPLLREADVIELEIDGLGVLRNAVAARRPAGSAVAAAVSGDEGRS